MRLSTLFAILAVALPGLAKPVNEHLDIEVIKEKHCTRKSRAGDQIEVHYKGTLEDGTKFDASYDRGQPLPLTLGAGQVIKGWDEGLKDMCEGEHRKLVIQPSWGYGSRAMGNIIPANSVLIFETELVKIVGSKDEL